MTQTTQNPVLPAHTLLNHANGYAPDSSENNHSNAAYLERYRAVRNFSELLCEPLVAEDYVIQSMPDVSPTKWHLAHTSWFFETFLLKPHFADYRAFHADFEFLFNSYYNSVGERHCRPKRGLVSRPTVDETYQYRAYVDRHMEQLIETARGEKWQVLQPLLTLGLHHEQQHQELMQTDIKHVFTENPLRPVYRERKAVSSQETPLHWIQFEGGLQEIGFEEGEFCFDNETPRHKVFAQPFALASRLATNGDYMKFMRAGGYQKPEFWLSMGWATVQENKWQAPFYWEEKEGEWWHMTLAGMRRVEENEPVCHLSYFEADAFARWSEARLPTEAEWEIAAQNLPLEGNFAEDGNYHPIGLQSEKMGLQQMFGDVWEWTQSSYAPYPGYAPPPGALGEYNGKFMCNQYVLRGGSCATPRSHIRRTYRNFFPPDACWQFTGVRLARDV